MALVLLLAMGGRVAAEETTMSYTEALERTDPLRSGHLAPGSDEERQALDRFADFIAEMTSASMRSRYASRNRCRFSDPISSSPSITTFTLIGNPPFFRYASRAAKWIAAPALSSTTPRP